MKRNHLVVLLAAAALSACTDPFSANSVRDYADVTTGGYHTCALTDTGEAYCWGRNSDGQLGTGDTLPQSRPVAVNTELRFRKITAGAAHTCGIATNDRTYCWGWNVFYQLGNGFGVTQVVPYPVLFDLVYEQISAGDYHTCGLTTDALVYCWGYNRWGQTGNGTTESATTVPTQVAAFRAQHISAGGQHTCAVAEAGGVYCWGSNEFGQLGIGADIPHFVTTPALVAGGMQFVTVDAGSTHTCGIDAGALAFCWGYNEFGQLGDAAPWRPGLAGPPGPSPVILLPGVIEISAGVNHSCATDNTGRTWCWGRGVYGQLAIGSITDQRVRQLLIIQPTLQAKTDLVRFEKLATGGAEHACALAEGSIFCWGTGKYGQLGGRLRFATVPQMVE
jgi:alpha-tubulin suppressor-like RCC1 family protein